MAAAPDRSPDPLPPSPSGGPCPVRAAEWGKESLGVVIRNILLLLVAAVLLGWALVEFRRDPVEVVASRWSGSPHADATSISFTNWDAGEPAVIPPVCARCHSLYGFRDFLGEDGTAPGVVENAARVGSVISCSACHNDSAHALAEVAFPSGEAAQGLGREAVCTACHQGRRSGDDVAAAIADRDPDAVDEGLGFIDVHYAIAAATQWGGVVRGAYQYPERDYAGVYRHAAPLRTCPDCHDMHSLAIYPDRCSPCHVTVVTGADLPGIRTTRIDYDGDGDVREGIRAEVRAYHDALYAAIREYAATVIGTPIVYAPGRSPFWFVDTDGDGVADPEEALPANRYTEWTPRLVRTTYNYHFVQEDPGAYAHNARYVQQVMYDALDDLSERVPVGPEGRARPER